MRKNVTFLVGAVLALAGIASAQTPSAPLLAQNPKSGGYTWTVAPGAAPGITFQASGGTKPYTFAVTSGSLPNGFSLAASTGAVTGSATLCGYYALSIQVTDSKGLSSTTPIAIILHGSGPMIMTQTLPSGLVGVAYSAGMLAQGGSPGSWPYLYSWSITQGTIPQGMSFANGFFSGTPVKVGAYNLVVTATDFHGLSYFQPVTLNINTLEVATQTLPDAVQGTTYNQTLTSKNGVGPYFWKVLSGILPDGLTLAGTGVLSGTPKSAGAFIFAVQVTDGSNRTAQQQLTLNVTPLLPLVITTKSLTDAVLGHAYSATLAATGGVPTYQWAMASGVLPPGISLNTQTGALSGSPTELGSYAFEIQLQDGNGTKASVLLTLNVDVPKPEISSIVSGASFSSNGLAAPGSILTIFCSSLGTQDFLNGFPSTSLAGVSVTLNGTPAPLFAVAGTKNQINLLIPPDLPAAGTVSVQVTSTNGKSEPVTLQMEPSTPGIFRLSDPSTTGRQFAVALFAGSAWLPIPASTATALKLPTNCSASKINPASACGQPAKPGDTLELFLTGLGLATPKGDPNGKPLSGAQVPPANGNPLYLTVQSPIVTVGGAAAEVLFSGLAPGFAGLYQVNIKIPGSAPVGDAIPVLVTMPNGFNDAAPIAVAAP